MQKFLTFTIAFLLAFWALGQSRSFEQPTLQTEQKLGQQTEQKTESTTINANTTTILTNVPLTVATTTKPIYTPKEKTTVTTPAPIMPPIPTYFPDFEQLNKATRKAIVNIFCSTKGRNINPISGTGILVNKDGIILTNAHVAQYLLVKDLYTKDYVECVIRTGSPAYPLYTTELVYISTDWVLDNYKMISDPSPKGTGENDFAFIKIKGRTDGSNLPTSFDFIEPDDRENILREENTLLVSYPAGFLGGISITQGLHITSAITTIKDIFTFGDGTIDVISVGGTVVSQKGASGGAVVDQYGKLIGVISTSTNADTTEQRDLRAITIAHINRAIQDELNITLRQFLKDDLSTFTKSFHEITVPGLTELLKSQLPK